MLGGGWDRSSGWGRGEVDMTGTAVRVQEKGRGVEIGIVVGVRVGVGVG